MDTTLKFCLMVGNENSFSKESIEKDIKHNLNIILDLLKKGIHVEHLYGDSLYSNYTKDTGFTKMRLQSTCDYFEKCIGNKIITKISVDLYNNGNFKIYEEYKISKEFDKLINKNDMEYLLSEELRSICKFDNNFCDFMYGKEYKLDVKNVDNGYIITASLISRRK